MSGDNTEEMWILNAYYEHNLCLSVKKAVEEKVVIPEYIVTHSQLWQEKKKFPRHELNRRLWKHSLTLSSYKNQIEKGLQHQRMMTSMGAGLY